MRESSKALLPLRTSADAELSVILHRRYRLLVHEAERNRVLGEMIRDRMAEIREALARLERGTFGVCATCGAAIDRARLEKQPQAPDCAACAGGPRVSLVGEG